MSYKIKRLSSDVNTWIFFLGGEALLLPIITAKLLDKKVIILLAGSIEREAEYRSDICYKLLGFFKKICCTLSTSIVVYSKSLIPFFNVEKFRRKIFVAHRHFLDFNTFTITTPLPDRPPFIGYIGRLSGEKGVQHFAQALPAILSDRKDLRVLIGGDGDLRASIEASLQEGGVTDRVDLPGWISHDDLPEHLNQLRLLVLPSYTEGLPNIMLEAMACGTPVLATPVGAIPDVIIDGKTGFIMENNSPECIAENVVRALNSPDLERIAEEGRRFVEENFTFEKVVENWRRILQDIS
jgi:glycosyltransferase involved in cell wall biosynthesis